MDGFRKLLISNMWYDGAIENDIIPQLIRCSKKMKHDCEHGKKLEYKREEEITRWLVQAYLKKEPFGNYTYDEEQWINHDEATNKLTERVDIKVASLLEICKDSNAFYIIECKIIDGENKRNRRNEKYVTDGVARFVLPKSESESKPKYPSYYKQNIMFGYVVKKINIPKNTDKIDRLQLSLLKGITSTRFVLEDKEHPQYYVYKCEYTSEYGIQITLNHLFFDFADAVHKV